MTRNFLIDDEGKTLIFLRGSDSSEIVPSETGLFGSGVYLTSEITDAEQYGKVRQYKVISERPYYTRADWSRDDVDSPAISMIKELLDFESEHFLSNAINKDGHFGSELQEMLLLWGHDSIVVQWPDMQHVIVFDPDQLVELGPNPNKDIKRNRAVGHDLSI